MEQLPPVAGDVEAKNISVGDYVVIKCSNPQDVCALHLPDISDENVCVWVVKVISVKVTDIVPGGDQRVWLRGRFYRNPQKDIQFPVFAQRSFPIKCETWDILNVYEGTPDNDNVVFTRDDIQHLTQIMLQILDRETNANT